MGGVPRVTQMKLRMQRNPESKKRIKNCIWTSHVRKGGIDGGGTGEKITCQNKNLVVKSAGGNPKGPPVALESREGTSTGTGTTAKAQ